MWFPAIFMDCPCAFLMDTANPRCKKRAVRMRNCRAPRCRVRDVTQTRAGVTDETLSRKSLARVQDTACKMAQVSSARTSRA